MCPPALTTGVGPHGRQVVHLQPPERPPKSVKLYTNSSFDDSVIDPALRSPKVSTQPAPHETVPISPLDSSDSSQPISGWSTPSGYQDFEPDLSQNSPFRSERNIPESPLSKRTPLLLSFLSNSRPSPISTQFPDDAVLEFDKENASPSKPLSTPRKLKQVDPLLATAIANAEKRIGPAVARKRTALEDSIVAIHS